MIINNIKIDDINLTDIKNLYQKAKNSNIQ